MFVDFVGFGAVVFCWGGGWGIVWLLVFSMGLGFFCCFSVGLGFGFCGFLFGWVVGFQGGGGVGFFS